MSTHIHAFKKEVVSLKSRHVIKLKCIWKITWVIYMLYSFLDYSKRKDLYSVAICCKKNKGNFHATFFIKIIDTQLLNVCNLHPPGMDSLILFRRNNLELNFESHAREVQLQLLKPSPSGQWGAKERVWGIWVNTCPSRRQKPYPHVFKITGVPFAFLSVAWIVYIPFAQKHFNNQMD